MEGVIHGRLKHLDKLLLGYQRISGIMPLRCNHSIEY